MAGAGELLTAVAGIVKRGHLSIFLKRLSASRLSVVWTSVHTNLLRPCGLKSTLRADPQGFSDGLFLAIQLDRQFCWKALA